MVKAKNSDLSYFDFTKSLLNQNTFSKKFKTKTAMIYSLVILLLFTIFNIITSLGTSTLISNQFISSVIGVPVFILIVFTLFYLFLSAFETKIKHFWRSYIVFSIVALHYIFIGNILRFIVESTYNSTITLIVSSLLVLLIIYFIINLTLSLKNYFKTTWQRIFVSFILVDILLGVLIIVQYFSMLISQLI